MRNIGVFEKIFGKQKTEKQVSQYFEMLNGYSPTFTSYEGGVYEMELTRAAIHSIANQASKLIFEVNGSARPDLQNTLKYKPNMFMTSSQFLYRAATMLETCNTCYIVPIENKYGILTGYYPVMASMTEVLDYNGEPYLKYWFGNGKTAVIEFSKVGVLTKFQLNNDFAGETNQALQPTMELINTQNQGIIEGVKNSAFVRFIAKINNFSKDEDIEKERKKFVENNLGASNNGGIILFNNTLSDVQQVNSQPFVINAVQQKQIEENVYSYFGVNADILQNKFNENTWNAFYEGKVEPFAIQMSLAMTNMTFTPLELSYKNEIMLTANRLQYASNTTKLNVSSQLFDRGILTTNQIMDIWNMSHVDDGDKRYIRKEYAEINKLGDDDSANSKEQGIQSVTDVNTTDGE